MARDTAPEYGVAQDFGKNFHEILYGLTSANKVIPIRINDDGSLDVNAVLDASDIEIGAVEIKDGSSNQRATVNGSGELLVAATITPSGTQNVNIVSTIPLPVTDNGGSLTVDGSVSISNFPASQSVTQGTSPWIVNGSGFTQPVSGTIAVSNFPATQPVSGTVTALQGTSPWISQPSFAAPQLDLFGRQRVGSPISLFNAQFLYDKQPLFWDELTASGGTSTYLSNESSINLAVTTASGSRVVRQSKEYISYEPGRAQLGELTAVFGAATANCKQMLGLFDDNDGCFFQLNGSTFGVTIRSSVSGAPVDTTVVQSSFNLDKLDGTGTSGVTLDFTKTQIFIIEYQWFGVGTVRFGVYVGNTIIYCHQVFHVNLDTTVYMKRGSLPVRYEIVNTAGTAGAVTFKQICTTVFSEAGYSPKGLKLSIDTGTTARNVAGLGSLPLLSIRLKSAYNRSSVVPEAFSILTDGANNFRYELILNGSLTGASFVSVNANSAVEYDISATALTGGTILHSGYVSSTTRGSQSLSIDSLLKLCANIAGTADILTLYVTNISALINYWGSLEWQEFN